MITEEQAIQVAQKVLKDIKFWGDDVINPKVQLIDDHRLSEYEETYLLVSFYYGEEDYGPQNATVSVILDPSTGDLIKKRVTTRGGSISIDYNKHDDKYFRT